MQYALVIDTCGGSGYVALCETGQPNAAPSAERILPARATQEQLLPAIQQVLDAARVPLSSVAIAVVNGPGSFTGVRIGLATAKGLCEAQGLSLITLSRLAILALAARLQSPDIQNPVWAWLDAGRGDVYAGLLQPGQTQLESEAMLTAEEASRLSANATIATIEESLQARTPEAILITPANFGLALRTAASTAAMAGIHSNVALSDALYLRIPDAELALRARQS